MNGLKPGARNPGHWLPPSVRFELEAALQQHRAGRLDRAEAGYKKVLRQIPNQPQALQYLTEIALARGEAGQAVKLAQSLASAFPDAALAHFLLGNSLAAAGRLEEATGSYRRSLELQPVFAAAHCNLALALSNMGRIEEAIAQAELAIAEDGGLVQARIALGSILSRASLPERAEAVFREAAALFPSLPEIWTALGDHLARGERPEEALTCYERAVAAAPAQLAGHHALGLCRFQLREMDLAIQSFEQALRIAPRHAPTIDLLGRALRALGRFEEARAAFKRAIEVAPQRADSYRNYLTTGGDAAEVRAHQRLAKILGDNRSPSDERILAGFALGKLLDDEDRFEEAFTAYRSANALKLEGIAPEARFDRQALERRVAALEDLDLRRFAETRPNSALSELPVFVVGMPRSGTSLVEQILASHPDVTGLGERRELGSLGARAWTDDLRLAAERSALDDLVEGYLSRLNGAAPGARRAIDKMPDNLFHLHTVAALLPGARVIVCRRDPLDTCLSCYFQHFTSGNAFSYDLEACGQRLAVTHRLADHWLATLDLSITEVRYEDLVSDLEGESRRLVDFLGLCWDERCLDFHRTNRVVATASTWQVRQPLYSHSVGRWRNYQSWLGPLSSALGASTGQS